MTWDGWHLTIIKNGSPWTVTTHDFTSGGPLQLANAQMVVSADGLEVLVADTVVNPYIYAYSTVTGAEVWSHAVYSVEPEVRAGVLIGSPRAGRYLWQDTTYQRHSQSVLWHPGGNFDDFGFPPDQYPIQEVMIYFTGSWTERNDYPYTPSANFQNGVTAYPSWDVEQTTNYYYPGTSHGNLGLNPNHVGYSPDVWEQTVWWDNSFATPPQTGNTCSFAITGSYGQYWDIHSAYMGISYYPTGTASGLIELRDTAGTVLSTIESPGGETWVPLKKDVLAYIRHTDQTGGGMPA